MEAAEDPVERDPLIVGASIISCKYIVYSVCKMLSTNLGLLGEALIKETGPLPFAYDTLLSDADTLFLAARRIALGKFRVHKILQGTQNDLARINAAWAVLLQLKREIRQPLVALKRSRLSQTKALNRIHELGLKTKSLGTVMQRHAAEAKAAFTLVTSKHSKVLRSPPPTKYNPLEGLWTIIAIDKVAYSAGVLALESLAGTQQVLEHNREIVNSFLAALNEVGADPAHTLIHSSGDGALIYLKDATQATLAAIAVRARALAKSLKIPDPKKWSEQFRIGIATGSVCVNRVGSLSHRIVFEAGGVSIINAVRIEAGCKPQQILICEETKKLLKEGLDTCFRRERKVLTKGHENRTIKAFEFSSDAFLSWRYGAGQALLGNLKFPHRSPKAG
jgi:class 3 adenylate cyclase